MTWPVLDDKLLADAAATYTFRLGVPAPLAITPDGCVVFRRTPARGFAADLFELSPDGVVRTLATANDLLGAGEETLSAQEKAKRERTRTATRGVVEIDVSADGATVFVPIGGRFVLIDRTSGARTTIDPGGAAYDPHLSPDGAHIAFVRDRALWLIGRTGAARALTAPPEGFEDGVADFAAQEELGRTRGYWWSPDGTEIAVQRTDNRAIDTIYVSDPRHPERAPVPFKYPRAGTANATVALGVVAIARATPAIAFDRTMSWDAEYLASVDWPANAPLTAQVLDRDQTTISVLVLEASGTRVLHTERDEAWINVNVGAPRWLPDGSAFLWMTERLGAWTLELRGRDGALVKQLTQPELMLHHLVGIDDGAAIAITTPTQTVQQVWRIPLDGAAPQRLDRDDGVANVTRAKHGVLVVETMLAAGGRKVTAMSTRGAHELPSVAEQPALVPTTVLETVILDGRLHNVAITRPRGFDAARRYPVLLKVYGGPHALMVQAARDSYVMDQWYADAGFIVVRSDNRGTPGRGREWERAVLRDLVTVPLADQVGALRAVAARHAELDMDRVGVTGWSFGGYMAAMAVLMHPELFKAAVAGAPVTDWALYDTAYTERYMKRPQDNPAGYAHGSTLTHAAKLARPLLIIHGITDDNVHFANALALVEELYVNAKRAEFITLSATHMVPDPKLALARERVQIEFFREKL